MITENLEVDALITQGVRLHTLWIAVKLSYHGNGLPGYSIKLLK